MTGPDASVATEAVRFTLSFRLTVTGISAASVPPNGLVVFDSAGSEPENS